LSAWRSPRSTWQGIYRGLTFSHGDFYYTMPGEYASRWNHTLWSSPDLEEARAYNKGAYYYGPTQYLTLFPVVFLIRTTKSLPAPHLHNTTQAAINASGTRPEQAAIWSYEFKEHHGKQRPDTASGRSSTPPCCMRAPLEIGTAPQRVVPAARVTARIV